MSKHTPGPWVIEETKGGPHGKFLSIGPGPGRECVIQMVWTPRAINAEDLANARLIAAAPDLLAACKAAVSSFTIEVPDGNETIRQLNEAIRKATEGIR